MSPEALPPIETVEDVFDLLETELSLLVEHLVSSFPEQVEDPVTEHFDNVGVSQTQLDETYADR